PGRLVQALSRNGWEPVQESDWLWVLQALNPEPDTASLPLLGRAFKGRSEALILRRMLPESGALITLRLWDSGVRLQPGDQVVYLVQVSEEQLVQLLGFFSYWRSAPYPVSEMNEIRRELSGFDQKETGHNVLLLRELKPGN
ncbi:MAG TPA: hypothetical protein VKN35_09475, partial [Xanthomonadales bacterium]|nr:hypothetical protein [Xanthomonadales bacterium]